jgi:hypothetical protein
MAWGSGKLGSKAMTILIKCERCGITTDVFESVHDEEDLASYYCLKCYDAIGIPFVAEVVPDQKDDKQKRKAVADQEKVEILRIERKLEQSELEKQKAIDKKTVGENELTEKRNLRRKELLENLGTIAWAMFLGISFIILIILKIQDSSINDRSSPSTNFPNNYEKPGEMPGPLWEKTVREVQSGAGVSRSEAEEAARTIWRVEQAGGLGGKR